MAGIIFITAEQPSKCRVLFGITAGRGDQIELPGGRPEQGETLQQTAARESIEEMGRILTGANIDANAIIKYTANREGVKLKTDVGEFVVWIVRVASAVLDPARIAAAPVTLEMQGFVALNVVDELLPFLAGAQKKIREQYNMRDRDAMVLSLARPAIWNVMLAFYC